MELYQGNGPQNFFQSLRQNGAQFSVASQRVKKQRQSKSFELQPTGRAELADMQRRPYGHRGRSKNHELQEQAFTDAQQSNITSAVGDSLINRTCGRHTTQNKATFVQNAEDSAISPVD